MKREGEKKKTHIMGSVIIDLDLCVCTFELGSKNFFSSRAPFFIPASPVKIF
jgi:hypothetical protein